MKRIYAIFATIILILVLVIGFLTYRLYNVQSIPKLNLDGTTVEVTEDDGSKDPESITTLSDRLCFIGIYFNGTCLYPMDINGDGEFELLLSPNSVSNFDQSILLKEARTQSGFEPFCESCMFEHYSGLIIYDDFDNDGMIEFATITVETEEYQFSLNYFVFRDGDYVLEKRTILDAPPDNFGKDWVTGQLSNM